MIAQQPFITFVLEDGSGTRDQTSVHVSRSASLASIEAAAGDFRGAVYGISDCVFVSQRIAFPGVVIPPPEATGPTPIYHSGVFIFGCDNDEYAILTMPALRPDLLLSDGLTINQASPDVAAFLGVLTSGLFANPFGQQIQTMEAAFLQYRP